MNFFSFCAISLLLIHHTTSQGVFLSFHDRTNWPNAFFTCISEGATLLTPDSLDDTQIIVSIFQYSKSTIWIGVHDLIKERKFIKSSGDNRIQYIKWQAGQPNSRTENCVIINTNGEADDRNCNESHAFFCVKYV